MSDDGLTDHSSCYISMQEDL